MWNLIDEVVSSKLFWVTLCQWAVLVPLIDLAQRTIVRRANGSLLSALADLLIMLVVAFLVLAVPLFAVNLFPLPIAKERSAFLAGAIVGGMLSILLRRQMRRWLERRGLYRKRNGELRYRRCF
jgi:hypothetical protein